MMGRDRLMRARSVSKGLAEVAMSRISKREEAELAAEFEQDADNEELWEDMPTPARTRRRKTLGTQVTIRLDHSSAEQLREIAHHRGVGYTSLLRSWVEERLDHEIATLRLSKPQITVAGESAGLNRVQISGPGGVVAAVG
jgi:uncharacterized protein (DUF4415 family)